MLYILSVAKNISQSFPVFCEFIGKISEKHSELKVCIYENNSTDGTQDLLSKWSLTDSRFSVMSETFTNAQLLAKGRACTKDNTPCRMEMIAFARNQLMEYVEPQLNDDDFVIWIDPDMKQCPHMDTLLFWLSKFPSWSDALLANGLSVNGKYYDSYAYRDRVWPFGVELLGEGYKTTLDDGKHSPNDWTVDKNKSVQKEYPFQGQMIPVLSAFGGLGIYRAKAIKGCRYSGTPTDDYNWLVDEICKNTEIHPHVKFVKGWKPETHIEGRLQGVYLFDSDEKNVNRRFYRNGSGYNFPVMCEHVTFHASMIRKGYANLFMCPSLLYFSDHWA